MLSYIDWHEVHTIVELGGGYGNMTREILKRKKPSTTLRTCEREQERFDILKTYSTDTCTISHEDALTCLQKMTDGSIDSIISTLPL